MKATKVTKELEIILKNKIKIIKLYRCIALKTKQIINDINNILTGNSFSQTLKLK